MGVWWWGNRVPSPGLLKEPSPSRKVTGSSAELRTELVQAPLRGVPVSSWQAGNTMLKALWHQTISSLLGGRNTVMSICAKEA